jgi:hypothetical protein
MVAGGRCVSRTLEMSWEMSCGGVIQIPLIVYRLHIPDLCSDTVSLAWPEGYGYCLDF